MYIYLNYLKFIFRYLFYILIVEIKLIFFKLVIRVFGLKKLWFLEKIDIIEYFD